MINKYEKLQDVVKGKRIRFLELRTALPLKGVYTRGTSHVPWIVIGADQTTDEKTCACAEALGHHETSSGNILEYQPYARERALYRAKKWAYETLLPLDAIGASYILCDANPFGMADHLGVSPQFLDASIAYYERRYGESFRTEQFEFLFLPFFSVISI